MRSTLSDGNRLNSRGSDDFQLHDFFARPPVVLRR